MSRLESAFEWVLTVLWFVLLGVAGVFLAYLAVTFAWALVQLTLTSVWGVDLP